MERLRVASLKELDALVGKYLTKEAPQIYWEEEQVCLRFDSIEEALEAMHDPYFQQFIPKDVRAKSSLTEVHEFRAYSSDLNCAWEVVERMNSEHDAFHVVRKNGHWVAAFADYPEAHSRSAPVAICLAALRARGIDVELVTEWAPAPPAQSRAVA
jgi:uncharacterized protein YecE (DUF72 family)